MSIPRSFSDKFQLRPRFVITVICRSKIVAYDVRSLSDHSKKVSNVMCVTDGNTGYAILEFHERITGELSDLAMGLRGLPQDECRVSSSECREFESGWKPIG